MAKTPIDIVFDIYTGNSFLTINEVRILEGLAPLFGDSEIHAENRNLPNKVICAYCRRPNEIGRELCKSCGAPLHYHDDRISR